MLEHMMYKALFELSNDRPDFLQGHPVHGFRRRSGRHGPSVAVNASIGERVQLGIEQLSIDVLQRQSSPAALTDDSQDSFGVPHLAYLPSQVSQHLPPFPL